MRLKAKAFIWNKFFDPVIQRIESRIEHYQSLRAITHDGSRWEKKAVLGKSVVFYPDADLKNHSEKQKLVIGNYCHIRGEILVYESGSFRLGTHSYLGSGSRIWCRQSIEIGSHVLISHLVDIHDTNSHSLDWKVRNKESWELLENGRGIPSSDVINAPIIIEDNVWIGFKSTILKGVTIGRGAVIAACSVVTKDVPAYALVAGNPARFVRELPR
jgi:acetyltransferase-like isoleucine patch superfamily enzyme